MGLTGTKPLEGWLSVGQAHQRIIHQDTLDIQNTLGCTTEYTAKIRNSFEFLNLWLEEMHEHDRELLARMFD